VIGQEAAVCNITSAYQIAAADKERCSVARKQPWFDFKQRSYPLTGAERPMI
jgi:hypothetical protein